MSLVFFIKLFLCVQMLAVMGVETGEAQLPNGLSPREVLERISLSIATNRSATETVVLRGRITTRGYFIDAGHQTPSSQSERSNLYKPFERRAKFVFEAAKFGEQKRWEAEWRDIQTDKVFRAERQALSGNIAFDVSERKGYIRDPSDFNGILFDFYRDHSDTFGGDLTEVLHFVEDEAEHWTVSRNNGEELITLKWQRTDGGITDEEFIDVRPNWAYLPSRYVSFGGIRESNWTWNQEPTTGIWYPAVCSGKLRMRFPQGPVVETTTHVEIDEVRFNQPVSGERFSLAGLGLQPGVTVYDMRVDPPVRYAYKPTAASAEQIVAGLVPAGAADETRKRVVTRKWWWRRMLITVNVVLLAVVAGFAFGMARRRRKTTKGPEENQ